jgi:hypothetical protein
MSMHDTVERTWQPTASQSFWLDLESHTHVHQTWKLETAPDPDALQQAMNFVVRRHAMMRTAFVLDEQRRWQAVTRSHGALSIEVVSFDSVPPDVALGEARALARERVKQPFTLQAAPLVRLMLVRLSDGGALVLFVAHHSVCDAWSCAIVFAELLRACAHYRVGSEPDLPSLPLEFADYAREQSEWLLSAAAAPHTEYWRLLVGDGFDPFRLPHDRQTPAHLSMDLPRVRGSLGHEFLAALRLWCREERVTVFACVATALAIAIARWSRMDEVFFLVIHLGRTRAELAGIVGTFTDSWLLRASLPPCMTLRDAIRRTRAAQIEASSHLRVTPACALEHLTSAGIVLSPWIMLNFLPWRPPTSTRPLARRIDLVPSSGQFDAGSAVGMVINATEFASSLDWQVQHNCGLFEDSTIEKLSASLAEILRGMASDADQPIQSPPHPLACL